MTPEARKPESQKARKQADLFDLPVPARATDTSKAAADSMNRAAPRLRRLVLQAIREAGPVRDGVGGMTADEVAARLELSPLTARPRVCELNKLGQIHDSRVRRKNRSGHKAIVWVAS
jgi:hypothetical protein